MPTPTKNISKSAANVDRYTDSQQHTRGRAVLIQRKELNGPGTFTSSAAVVAIVAGVLLPLPADAEERVVLEYSLDFPAAHPGKTFTLVKTLDVDTGLISVGSADPALQSASDMLDLEEEEHRAEYQEYGNLSGEIRQKLSTLQPEERIRIVVYLRTPVIPFLDPEKYSLEELETHSRALLDIKPLVRPEEISRAYGVPVDTLVSNDAFQTEVTKKQLEAMMFDDAIIAIELVFVSEPLATLDYTSFAESAYNPPPLPLDAQGLDVHAATFELGIWQDHFNCLGNLDPANIVIDDTRDSLGAHQHSNEVFRFLWNAAPEATFFHHNQTNFDSITSQTYMVDNSIETASISYERRNTRPHAIEFLIMDEFAYRFPFPVYVNPTANDGYDLEVHWQPYNAISVGNVRHTEQRHYEHTWVLSSGIDTGCTQTRNPDPEYGTCLDGSPGPICAGDREMPHVVAPGITPAAPLSDMLCTGQAKLGQLYCGTSFSAPTLNGIAAAAISADPARMKYQPEKVRLALMLTAHNVDSGHWDVSLDGRDGTGVVSGTDAVWFAKNHQVPDLGGSIIPLEHGLAAGVLGGNDQGRAIEFKVKVPDTMPADRHLRILLTWTSIPDRDTVPNRNSLSDLDLVFSADGQSFNYASMSADSNIEVIDVPNTALAAGRILPVRLLVTTARIPPNPRTTVFKYALGWTWVQDHAQFDPDLNGCVDRADVTAVLNSVRGLTPLERTYDLNGDGVYNIADVRKVVTMCTMSRCAPCP